MKVHPALALVPAAGAVGATVMSYNAGIDIAQYKGVSDASQYSINTAELNFMGAQDAFISGSLLIGFAALARGVYLYAQGNHAGARKYFGIGGGMLMAAGLYALTAGFFDLGIPGSRIGDFSPHPRLNGTIFGLVYSALTAIGAALMGTGYKMSQSNPKSIVVTQDDHSPAIGNPKLTASSDKEVAQKNNVPHDVLTYGTDNNNNNNNINTGSQLKPNISWGGMWSSMPSSVPSLFGRGNKPGPNNK